MNRTLRYAVAAAVLTSALIADAQQMTPPERQIRPSWSGSWVPEGQPGHGIHVQVLTDGRAVFYWTTYDADGNQIWLVAVSGEIYPISLADGFLPSIRIEATAYITDGMRFGSFNPDAVNLTEWGHMTVTFGYHWCDTYAGMAWEPIVPGFSSGEVELQRLTEIVECKDNDFTYGGVWDVQLSFDGPKTAVEVEVVENDDNAPSLLYEFTDVDNCVWAGEIQAGFGLITTQGEKDCSGSVDSYSMAGAEYAEHNLCSDEECTRLDRMLFFRMDNAQLIFTR